MTPNSPLDPIEDLQDQVFFNEKEKRDKEFQKRLVWRKFLEFLMGQTSELNWEERSHKPSGHSTQNSTTTDSKTYPTQLNLHKCSRLHNAFHYVQK